MITRCDSIEQRERLNSCLSFKKVRTPKTKNLKPQSVKEKTPKPHLNFKSVQKQATNLAGQMLEVFATGNAALRTRCRTMRAQQSNNTCTDSFADCLCARRATAIVLIHSSVIQGISVPCRRSSRARRCSLWLHRRLPHRLASRLVIKVVARVVCVPNRDPGWRHRCGM